jgi:hypothetical protein
LSKAESRLRYKICTKTQHSTSKLLKRKSGSPTWIRTTVHGPIAVVDSITGAYIAPQVYWPTLPRSPR